MESQALSELHASMTDLGYESKYHYKILTKNTTLMIITNTKWCHNEKNILTKIAKIHLLIVNTTMVHNFYITFNH